MSLYFLVKIFACAVTGMLGIPIGMLPSVLLFRNLADGVNVTEARKKAYAHVLWGGMVLGWIIGCGAAWLIISYLVTTQLPQPDAFIDGPSDGSEVEDELIRRGFQGFQDVPTLFS
ncbi:MAG: hypothetical protein GKR97_13835, partial [Rhizobiaceae bacterium]|nr:hypothetical protein [Rhizobiaceae bacterium]